MRNHQIFPLVSLILASCQVPQAQPSIAKPTANTAPAKGQRGAEALARWESQRLAYVGLVPIDSVARMGIEIRRVGWTRWPFAAASVTLQRDQTGRVTVRIWGGGTALEGAVAEDLWRALIAKDEVAFAARRAEEAPPPTGMCHGSEVTLEGASGRTIRRQGAHSCGLGNQAQFDYAADIARVALLSIPDCAGTHAKGLVGIEALLHCTARSR